MITSIDFQDQVCALIDSSKGSLLTHGEEVESFRGDRMRLIGGKAPHKPSSEGKVFVEVLGDAKTLQFRSEYYASVIGAEWVPIAEVDSWRKKNSTKEKQNG